MKGEGRLAHKFHGTYWCAIVIGFDSADHAIDAQRALGDPWKVHPKEPKALIAALDSAQLDAFKTKYAPKARPCKRRDCRHGCVDAAIDNLNHSVDVGPIFDVEIPTTPHEQCALLGVGT